jgi:hypothetical protein
MKTRNNSQKPHTASTDSYTKYSNLKLQNLEIQGFKISRILEWGGGVTPRGDWAMGLRFWRPKSHCPITALCILRWQETGWFAQWEWAEHLSSAERGFFRVRWNDLLALILTLSKPKVFS